MTGMHDRIVVERVEDALNHVGVKGIETLRVSARVPNAAREEGIAGEQVHGTARVPVRQRDGPGSVSA